MATGKLNYGEWGEIYALLKLVSDGRIGQTDEHERVVDGFGLDITEVIRREAADRVVSYEVPRRDEKPVAIICVNGLPVGEKPLSEFRRKAVELLDYVRRGQRAPFAISGSIQSFLDDIEVTHYKASSTDKSDIYLSVIDPRTGTHRKGIGYSIKTKWSQKATLFNTGNGSRAVFEIDGRLSDSLKDSVNALTDSKGNADVLGRMRMLKEHGCALEFRSYAYCDRAGCRAFQENLSLINPRLVSVWQSVMREHFENGSFAGGTNDMQAICDWLVKRNPCDIERAEVNYPYMIKAFLYAAYCGMTASTLWDGRSNVNGGLLTVDNDGNILAFSALESDAFKSYLFNHCCIDYPSTSKRHGNYGSIYSENGSNYFDLNFQIRFKSY